jgi:hypothetical protein
MIHETKDQKLIDGSIEHFERNPTVKELFASEDGQYFFSVSRSNYHCKTRGLKLYRISRSQIEKSAPEPKPEKKAPEKKAEPAKTSSAKGVGSEKKPSKPK